MIISVEKAMSLVDTRDLPYEKIRLKLLAIEQIIRGYTHKNYQARAYRRTADIIGGSFLCTASVPFDVGDTVQISESGLNAGLFTVKSVSNSSFAVNEKVRDEIGVLVTKIVYPADVVQCCLNILEWEIKNRDKVGVKSETLSRHSVTYDVDSTNHIKGYPASLFGCLSKNGVWC